MKNTQQTLSILFFLLVSLSLSNDLISQRLQINMDNSVVRQGETVCIDLVVENFTDLIVVGFALSWDPAILEYVETTNLPIPLVEVHHLMKGTWGAENCLFHGWMSGQELHCLMGKYCLPSV